MCPTPICKILLWIDFEMIGNCYNICTNMMLLVETAKHFLPIQRVASFQNDANSSRLAVVVNGIVNVLNRCDLIRIVDQDVIAAIYAVAA